LFLLAIPLTFVMAAHFVFAGAGGGPPSANPAGGSSRSLIVAGLEPGRFIELPNNGGEMYVEGMNSDGTKFTKMFVASERENTNNGTTSLNIVTAADGELYHDADGSGRYLGLNDGFRVEAVIGQENYRLMRYQRNDIKLQSSDSDNNADSVQAQRADGGPAREQRPGSTAPNCNGA